MSATSHMGDHGVDLAALEQWMEEQNVGHGPITDVAPLAGGTQNILLRFRRGDADVVLRHPPPHKRKNSDETMRREARVLAAIADTDVPHPRLIAACPDLDVLGSAFYLMEPAEGINPGSGLPEPLKSDPELQMAMGLSIVDGIASLARVDHVAVGLGDFGRAEGWLERQVPRWQRQLDSYAELDGYDGPDIPHLDEVATWLDANRPSSWVPGLIHGDYHYLNVIVDPSVPALSAIVDWELTTIGDPLLDLSHFLAMSADPDLGGSGLTAMAPGLPGPDDVIARYGEMCDRALDDLPWFRVLACYRMGIILEGSNARADAGLAPREIGDRLHASTMGLFDRAHRLIGRHG